MWQKGSKSSVASVDFAHRTSFLTHIYQIHFQMFGYKPFCLSAEYNETVASPQIPNLFIRVSPCISRILLFIHSSFLRKGRLPDYFSP